MRHPAPPREIPPPLELACLKTLWEIREGTVRDVRTALAQPFAYTTVMTLLDRLEKRGAVSRRKQGRSFLYAPKLSREIVRQRAVKELVDTFFDGSKELLASYLAELSR